MSDGRTFMRASIAVVWVMGVYFAGCSFKSERADDSGGPTVKAEVDDRNALLKSHSKVEGTYTGKIQGQDGSEIPFELSLFSKDEALGRNARGETKFLPQLWLRFRRTDRLSIFQVIEARYLSETGELIAGSSTSSQCPSDPKAGDPVTIRAQWKAGDLEGQVSTKLGLLGNFKAQLKDRQVSSDPAGEANEYNRMIKEKLQVIVGLYEGSVSLGNAQAVELEIRVDLLEENKGNVSEITPVVTLREPNGNLPQGLATGIYKPETSPPEFSFSKDSNNGGYRFTGTLKDGALLGNLSFYSNRGRNAGALRASKVKEWGK